MTMKMSWGKNRLSVFKAVQRLGNFNMFTSKRITNTQENIFTMKATMAGLISRSTFFVGSLLLLMFARGCMAVPVYGGAGGISQVPSIRDVKIVTRANVVFLSKIVGETQVDFAQIRLGDQFYDGYVPRIPGLPVAIWHQDKIPEQTLLKKIVEDLYIFSDFFTQIKNHEVQKKSNFVTHFQQISDELNIVISSFQQLEMYLGYTATHRTTAPQPTSNPAATPKEQDEWALGVQKELLYWLIPVQGELNRQIMHS